jgi:Cu+-exporting ATPase
LLSVAAALAQHSTHPLSIALAAHARSQGITPDAVSDFHELAGNGLSAVINGETSLLGSPAFIANPLSPPP